MATSFVENVNLLASKVDVVEEANSLFDENVIPILEEIADLDLDAAVEDLLKGNYLGNRKIDVNLALNVQGITEELLLTDPDQAEAIWTDTTKTVQYDKAIVTFTDGEVITLPFMFDNVPVTISTHGDLLAQLSRLDYAYAVSQVDSVYQVNVSNNTEYIITIDNVECKFTSPDTATTKEIIIAGLAQSINTLNISVSAVIVNGGSKLNLVAKVPGAPFFASTSANLTLTNVTPNSIEGPKETAFSAKLTGTLAANFAAPVVGEIVRLYDVTGQNSNIERISLHAVSGKYVEEYTLFYWAKTTSAFQTLSMRANDIIRLGDEIDNIIKLASRIGGIIEIQGKLPQLIDTYSPEGVPNGDLTIYNSLDELIAIHTKLNEIITVYHDVKEYGTKYIEAVALNLRGDDTIGTVATDLRLGVDSNVIRTGEHITDVTTVSSHINNVDIVSVDIESVNTVASDLKLGISSAIKNTGNNIASVNKASANITNINTVATDLQLGVNSNVKKVGENITDVITVNDDIDNVVTVSTNINNINTVSADLNLGVNSNIKIITKNITDILTVSNDVDNVISVSTNMDHVNIISTDLNLNANSAIKKTGNSITSVNTVSTNIDKVIATANNATNINLVVSEIIPNLAEILLTDDNALIAKNKALEATNAAAVATTKANEIKNVSVDTTITGVPGSNASVVYNPTNGKFTFVIPQGVKGDKGEAFTVNSIGTFTQRALYDSQVAGFSYLAVDVNVAGSIVPHIYFKKSATSGDWTTGIPFGRGEKGDTGDAGSQWRNGSGVPANILGKDNDFYLDTVTGNMYQRLAGTYQFIAKVALLDDTTINAYNTWSSQKISNELASKQATDVDLTAIAGLSTSGFIVRTGNGTAATRIMTAGSSKVNITNGNGLTANPTFDIVEANLSHANIGGTTPVSKGGTGATTLTGVLKGNGTGAFTAAVAGTDYVVPSGSITGNAGTATKLQTARKIAGIPFDGTADIILPGVNTTGNQNTSGNAGSATKLATVRTIAGIPFDGTANINIPFANISSTPTTLGGYSITDAYTAAEIGTMAEFTANLN